MHQTHTACRRLPAAGQTPTSTRPARRCRSTRRGFGARAAVPSERPERLGRAYPARVSRESVPCPASRGAPARPRACDRGRQDRDGCRRHRMRRRGVGAAARRVGRRVGEAASGQRSAGARHDDGTTARRRPLPEPPSRENQARGGGSRAALGSAGGRAAASARLVPLLSAGAGGRALGAACWRGGVADRCARVAVRADCAGCGVRAAADSHPARARLAGGRRGRGSRCTPHRRHVTRRRHAAARPGPCGPPPATRRGWRGTWRA